MLTTGGRLGEDVVEHLAISRVGFSAGCVATVRRRAAAPVRTINIAHEGAVAWAPGASEGDVIDALPPITRVLHPPGCHSEMAFAAVELRGGTSALIARPVLADPPARSGDRSAAGWVGAIAAGYPVCMDARETVGRLVNLARDGEVDAVVGSLSLLSYADPVQRNRLRQILGTLIEVTASLLLRHAEPSPENGMFAVDLRRPDGSDVDIDTLDPPVRAAIRALLAQVNGSPEDSAAQIDLAVAGGVRGTAEAVVLALRWAVNAVESCTESGVPLPDWLRSAG